MAGPGSQDQPDEYLVDLAVKLVAEGLSPAEQRELDAMDSAVAAQYLRDLERAAAAVTLAASASIEPLPENLRRRVERQAIAHFGGPGAAATNVVELSASRRSASRGSPRGAAAAGWLAAAACLVLAVFAWLRPFGQTAPPVAAAPVPVPPPVVAPPVTQPPPTPAEARAGLLAKAGSLKVSLAATKDPAAAGVTGDVVWDPATQSGFVRFAGLSANDPKVRQYQIWIFDAERDQRYPVDGGVFDVPANVGEVVIPIRAALLVHKPAAFAVTVEKPGGVVVSARGHVVALGAAS